MSSFPGKQAEGNTDPQRTEEKQPPPEHCGCFSKTRRKPTPLLHLFPVLVSYRTPGGFLLSQKCLRATLAWGARLAVTGSQSNKIRSSQSKSDGSPRAQRCEWGFGGRETTLEGCTGLVHSHWLFSFDSSGPLCWEANHQVALTLLREELLLSWGPDQLTVAQAQPEPRHAGQKP